MTTQQRSGPSGPTAGRKFTIPYDVPSFTAVVSQFVVVTVPGARVTDIVRVASIIPNTGEGKVAITRAVVTAPDTVSINLFNQTGTGIVGDPGASIVGELGLFSS